MNDADSTAGLALARHSTPQPTLDVCAHLTAGDERQAVEALSYSHGSQASGTGRDRDRGPRCLGVMPGAECGSDRTILDAPAPSLHPVRAATESQSGGMADAMDSKSISRKGVGVRFPPLVPARPARPGRPTRWARRAS